MSDHHTMKVPRAVLLGAGAMILCSVALAASARRAHLAAPPAAPEPLVQSVLVRFLDRPDGAIAALAAGSGQPLGLVPPRTGGFVRGVLRGMFRTRKLEGKGPSEPFRLSCTRSGRMYLDDPQTGRRVDLDSFGPTNAAAFSELSGACLQAQR